MGGCPTGCPPIILVLPPKKGVSLYVSGYQYNLALKLLQCCRLQTGQSGEHLRYPVLHCKYRHVNFCAQGFHVRFGSSITLR